MFTVNENHVGFTIDDIRAGMFLLVQPAEPRGTEPLADTIVDFQNLWVPPEQHRFFSHAVAVVGSPQGLQVLESTLPRARQIMLSSWLAEQKGKIHAAVVWDDYTWTPESDVRAWAFAFPFLDQGYNWPAIFPWMALWEALGRITPPVPQMGGMVCSVLATAIIQAGLGLKPGDKDWRNPLAIDPNRIPDLPIVSKTVELTLKE
jgi:hypothetical protein